MSLRDVAYLTTHRLCHSTVSLAMHHSSAQTLIRMDDPFHVNGACYEEVVISVILTTHKQKNYLGRISRSAKPRAPRLVHTLLVLVQILSELI